jgi:hypothetical protein
MKRNPRPSKTHGVPHSFHSDKGDGPSIKLRPLVAVPFFGKDTTCSLMGPVPDLSKGFEL